MSFLNLDREKMWAAGFHLATSGKSTTLKDLPTNYLENIVKKYGADHDVSAVKSEIESRPKV